MSSLRDRFGSARRPERTVVHQRPSAPNPAPTMPRRRRGKVSAAFEVVENARGTLYAFHRMSGEADLALQDALESLRAAGHRELADEIDDVLVGQ